MHLRPDQFVAQVLPQDTIEAVTDFIEALMKAKVFDRHQRTTEHQMFWANRP